MAHSFVGNGGGVPLPPVDTALKIELPWQPTSTNASFYLYRITQNPVPDLVGSKAEELAFLSQFLVYRSSTLHSAVPGFLTRTNLSSVVVYNFDGSSLILPAEGLITVQVNYSTVSEAFITIDPSTGICYNNNAISNTSPVPVTKLALYKV